MFKFFSFYWFVQILFFFFNLISWNLRVLEIGFFIFMGEFVIDEFFSVVNLNCLIFWFFFLWVHEKHRWNFIFRKRRHFKILLFKKFSCCMSLLNDFCRNMIFLLFIACWELVWKCWIYVLLNLSYVLMLIK